MKRRQFALTAMAALFGSTCLALAAPFSTFAAEIAYGNPGAAPCSAVSEARHEGMPIFRFA